MIREFAEKRGEGFYAAGIRVSMASVVHHFWRGASPETILPKFPALGSLSTVYGAIAFYLDNLVTLDDWLIGQQQEWKNLRLPPTRLRAGWPKPSNPCVGLREGGFSR